jgi:uncharacterized membrane protein YfcA
VGGGGSILTVPALVHAGGFAPRDAIVASLIVVGVATTAGALLHWRLGTLDIGVAGWFGGLGAVGAMGSAPPSCMPPRFMSAFNDIGFGRHHGAASAMMSVSVASTSFATAWRPGVP